MSTKAKMFSYIDETKSEIVKKDITSVEELANDDDFIRWVKEGALADEKFWTAWAQNNSERKKLVEEAKQLILFVNFHIESINQSNVNKKWQEIERKISNNDYTKETIKIYNTPNKKNFMLRVAAVVIPLIFFAGLTYYIFYTAPITERTGYGVTKNITLPDGSSVILNANSEISFSAKWNSKIDRKVKLKGEAFFNVTHTINNQKFIVYTDKMKIKVLGTQFNVNSRKHKEQVVLTSGKIKLFSKLSTDKNEILMEPGDMVELKDDELLVKKLIEPEKFSSWKNGQIVLENTSIAEVIEMLEDNYGYSVDIKNKELLEKRLYSTATIETKDVKLIITIISELYNVEIIEKSKKKLEVKENKLP